VFVSSDDKRLGSSGVFKAIVTTATKIKRALSESDADEELPLAAEELGTQIAQAFVASRFGDVHALGTKGFQKRTSRAKFEESWRDAATSRGPLTGFEISNAGRIDLQYIPGLEEVQQERFVAFLEIVFSAPDFPIEHPKAFAIGAVLLAENGEGIRIGAIHAR
jgi:hypothetical protein